MKSLNFNIQEIGIDTNDVKILVSASFQYLTKTCYQWVKDHPLVSGVLLFFYLLYIFFPPLFSILFYTFPLVMCFTILLGGQQFNLEKHQINIQKGLLANTSDHVHDSTTIDHTNHRAYLQQPQMSRRTFGRQDSKTNNIFYNNKDIICNDNNEENNTTKVLAGVTPNISETESQSEEDEVKNKLVVEWTEDDQQNLMDLGSSEIERNKRLESLIAKRRARKLYSMQPRRNNFYLFDQEDLIMDHQVTGSVLMSRGGGIDDDDHQPGSAPSVLLPIRNPFDLPYDPYEEKPVLTGGSFDEEFFHDDEQQQHKDSWKDYSRLCNNNGHDKSLLRDFKDDYFSKPIPSFVVKPVVASNTLGFTKLNKESDDEGIKKIEEELSNREAQSSQVDANYYDKASMLHSSKEDEPQYFENPFAIYDENITSDDHSTSLPELKDKITNDGENIFHVESKLIRSGSDNTQPIQMHVVLSDYKRPADDKEDEESSSSSSSEVTTFNAAKNEAFRNSVRKVLTCLAFPRNKVMTTSDPNDLLACHTSPTNVVPTKMQERSIYTRPTHTSNYSIASDMQVEVSETGSPTMATIEASSQTDHESYDGDIDKDANSGDEDLLGASPHPMRLGEVVTNFKLPDLLDKKGNNKCSNLSHESDYGLTLRSSREVREEGEDHQQVEVERIALSSSPRSILLDDDNDKLEVDVNSTNGDIMETRSSSSSESLTSQMQHVEDVRPSHMLEQDMEEVNSTSDIHENKEELRESKGSEGSSEKSTLISPNEVLKETNSTSNDLLDAYELNMEHANDATSTTEQFDQLRNFEGEGDSMTAMNINELISDSYSTTYQEDLYDQSRLVEDMKTTPQSQV